MSKIQYVCEACGSEEVGQDAFCHWDFDSQKWEISNLTGTGFCFECENSDLKEVTIEGDTP